MLILQTWLRREISLPQKQPPLFVEFRPIRAQAWTGGRSADPSLNLCRTLHTHQSSFDTLQMASTYMWLCIRSILTVRWLKEKSQPCLFDCAKGSKMCCPSARSRVMSQSSSNICCKKQILPPWRGLFYKLLTVSDCPAFNPATWPTRYR